MADSVADSWSRVRAWLDTNVPDAADRLQPTTIAPKLGCKQEFLEEFAVPASDFSLPPEALLPSVSLEKRRHKPTSKAHVRCRVLCSEPTGVLMKHDIEDPVHALYTPMATSTI